MSSPKEGCWCCSQGDDSPQAQLGSAPGGIPPHNPLQKSSLGQWSSASGMAHGKVELSRCSRVLEPLAGERRAMVRADSHLLCCPHTLDFSKQLPWASQKQSKSWPFEKPPLSSLCFIPKSRISLDSSGRNTVNGKRTFLCQTPGP